MDNLVQTNNIPAKMTIFVNKSIFPWKMISKHKLMHCSTFKSIQTDKKTAKIDLHYYGTWILCLDEIDRNLCWKRVTELQRNQSSCRQLSINVVQKCPGCRVHAFVNVWPCAMLFTVNLNNRVVKADETSMKAQIIRSIPLVSWCSTPTLHFLWVLGNLGTQNKFHT